MYSVACRIVAAGLVFAGPPVASRLWHKANAADAAERHREDRGRQDERLQLELDRLPLLEECRRRGIDVVEVERDYEADIASEAILAVGQAHAASTSQDRSLPGALSPQSVPDA